MREEARREEKRIAVHNKTTTTTKIKETEEAETETQVEDEELNEEFL